MNRRLLVAVALATALSACTSSGSSSQPAPSLPSNPPHARLVATADLDRCPGSSARRTSDLPDVTLPCLGAGPAVHLAGLRGPLVVNIWGSWCEPCQKESPYLARVYDEMRGHVGFLGVDDEDDPDSALDFAAHVRPPMKYPSVVDNDKKVLIAVHSTAVPLTLFVTANGRVVHTNFEYYRSAAALRADIARYLGVTA